MAIKTSLSSGGPSNQLYAGSVYFDGNGDYLACSSNAVSGTTEFTMEAWIYMSQTSTVQHIASQYSNASTNGRWYFSVAYYAANDLSFVTPNLNVTANNVIFNNIWYHVALTRTNTNANPDSTYTLFVNGQQVATTSYTGTASRSLDTAVTKIGGQNSSSTTGYLTGYISNFRVVNSILFTSNFIPPTSPLTAIPGTSLLTCQGTTRDRSTNNFAITVNGNTTVNTLSPFTESLGTFTLMDPNLGSVYFDGNGDYLTVPSNVAFSLPGNFTIEAWVYIAANSALDGSGYRNAIIASTQQSGPTDGFTFQINGSSAITGTSLGVEFRVSGANTGYSSTAVNILQNTWNHICFVRNSTTITYYLNGENIGTSNASQNVPTGGALTIGAQTIASYNRYLNGYISNLRFVNGTAVYTSNFTLPTSPLIAIANTNLLTCQGPSLRDASANNFAVTVNGNAAYNDFSPSFTLAELKESVVESGSIYFNTNGVINLPASSQFAISSNQDFTLECWVYLSSSRSDYTYMVDFIDSSSNILQIRIGNAGFGYRVQGTFGPGASPSSVYENASYTQNNLLNVWTHLALCRSGTTTNFFFNGVIIATRNSVGTIVIGTPSVAARLGRPSPELFDGYISNIRFVKGTAVYTNNFSPLTNLTNVINTVLLLKSSRSDLWLKDDSVNNFAITPVDNASYSSFSPEIVNTVVPYKLTDSGIDLNIIDEVTLNSGSLYFDGNGSYLTISNSTAFQIGTNNFTIEFWSFVQTLPSTYKRIFSVSNPTVGVASDEGIIVEISNTNVMTFSVFSGTVGYGATDIVAIPVNRWVHWAFVRNETLLTIFKNGISAATYTLPSNLSINWTSNFITIIGRWASSVNRDYHGFLSNIQFVKNSAVYISNFTPSVYTDNLQNTSLLLPCISQIPFKDISSNNFSLIQQGDLKYSNFSVVNNYNSGSLYFDGNGDLLTLPSSSSFNFSTIPITFEFWMFPLSLPGAGNDCRILMSGVNASNSAFQIYFNSTSQIGAGLPVGGTTGLVSPANTIQLNTWQHVAVVLNDTNSAIYFNGVAVASGPITTPTSSNNSFKIGYDTVATVNYNYKGYISNIRIVNGTAVYTTNFTPPMQLLTAVPNTVLLLNTASATTDITDSSPNNFTVTRVGNTVFSNVTPINNIVQKIYNDGTLAVREFVESNTF